MARDRSGRTAAGVLAVLTFAGGVAAFAWPVVQAAQRGAGYQPVKALFIALGVMLVITALLLIPIRKHRVAARNLEWTDVDGGKHEIRNGWVVPDTAVGKLKDAGAAAAAPMLGQQAAEAAAPERGVSALRGLYRGKDNRASTSKSVALAWTYAVVFGLIAFLALKLMGDDTAWKKMVQSGDLPESYLLLLGGPYAAAVIAKYAAVTGSAGQTKTADPGGAVSPGADAKNLVADDVGDTDLGDFQYVLFNLVALAFFFSTLISHPANGLPDLPPLLVGLALTSAATYTAKKAAVSAAGPQLTSLFPTTATANDPIDLYGRNLVTDGVAPKISVGPSTVASVDVVQTAGSGDHLKFLLPTSLQAGDQQVRVTIAATGALAQGPGGSDSLKITVV